ncbi:hypothetical protein KOI35_10985 [Actinoplanes bogorensis]|uniref:HEAT repeat domain-containing protein n=1 Tax=Paractinoplanes bogorensis TaxID=1610840 RepID=A0ABS5YKM3_9ACTN|nr:hypothetical protein [Actinoplanes bogorensis]MBU2664014.1 hypothetical protein [Actinoplanes bogorensis]
MKDESVDEGVALLALALNHPDPDVVLPRIRRALASSSPQTRANALQSLGHVARLHRTIDADLIGRLRSALRDRSRLHRTELRAYAANAADDVAMFVPRRDLPRWLRRAYPGPRLSSRAGGTGRTGGRARPGSRSSRRTAGRAG